MIAFDDADSKTVSKGATMTADDYEKLPPEEKDTLRRAQNAAKSLIGEAWTKYCSIIPTTSIGRTFSILGQ